MEKKPRQCEGIQGLRTFNMALAARECVMFQDGEIHKKGEVRDEKEFQTPIAWLRHGTLINGGRCDPNPGRDKQKEARVPGFTT